jgi:hypothetical protein
LSLTTGFGESALVTVSGASVREGLKRLRLAMMSDIPGEVGCDGIVGIRGAGAGILRPWAAGTGVGVRKTWTM